MLDNVYIYVLVTGLYLDNIACTNWAIDGLFNIEREDAEELSGSPIL